MRRSSTKVQLWVVLAYSTLAWGLWTRALKGQEAGKIRQPERRRSTRRALELPIRVFGTDFQGRDFVEDSATLVVSRHGAKIRLIRKLIPEQEIHILSSGNNREAPFRVVGQVGEPTSEVSFWGVECLEPGQNIWEGALPKPGPELDRRPGGPKLDSKPYPREELSSMDKSPVQVMVRCSNCDMRELINLDEAQIKAIRRAKGLVRGCPACGATGLWKRVAVQGSRSI